DFLPSLARPSIFSEQRCCELPVDPEHRYRLGGGHPETLFSVPTDVLAVWIRRHDAFRDDDGSLSADSAGVRGVWGNGDRWYASRRLWRAGTAIRHGDV